MRKSTLATMMAMLLATSVATVSCAPARSTNDTAASSAVVGETKSSSLPVAPLWEAASAAGAKWTKFAASVVDESGADLLMGTSDVKDFCPAYFTMSRDEKINFWVYLVSAVTKYESGFDPTSRMKEPGLGNDPITHKPVYSEGLLQLSYQDQIAFPFCDQFDWKADSKLAARDPRKSIFDPDKNLACGIRILNEQVRLRDKISFHAGQYWSTLRPKGGHNSRVVQIKALTHGLSFCKK